MPLEEYSILSFSKDLLILTFFEILLSIVSISRGSAAAKIMASISFSIGVNFVGKLITLSFLSIFFFFS